MAKHKIKVNVHENAWDIDRRFAELHMWFELNKNNGDFAANKKFQKIVIWLRKASKFDQEQKKKVYFSIILKSIDDAYSSARPLFEDIIA